MELTNDQQLNHLYNDDNIFFIILNKNYKAYEKNYIIIYFTIELLNDGTISIT